MSHEFLAASMAGVFAYCAGAPLLATMYPEESSIESMTGDAAHWVLSEVLSSYKPESDHIIYARQFINTRAPNNIVITDEMVECVQVMVDDVLSVAQEFGLLNNMHVEEKMMMPDIHRNNGGTPDLWMVDVKRKHIYNYDYKHGHLDIPADSWQNIDYLSGIKTILNINGHDETEWVVTLKIVQPRSYSASGPIKSVTTPVSDYRGHFNQLRSQAEKAHLPDPGTTAGLHCRYCPAKHNCEAARKSAYALVDYVGSATPEVLSGAGLSFEIGLLRSAIKMAEGRLEAAETEAKSRIQSGNGHVPGWVVEQSSGKRVFKGDPEHVFVMGDLLGVDLREKSAPKPATPAEAERRIKSINTERRASGLPLIDVSVLSPYIEKPKGAFKLIESDASSVIKAFTQT